MRAEAFDMNVHRLRSVHQRSGGERIAVELVTLEKLLAESDFISMHTALSPATQKMINAQSIAKMKKGGADRERGARRADRRSGAGGSAEERAPGWRGAGRFCGRAAEEFAADGAYRM